MHSNSPGQRVRDLRIAAGFKSARKLAAKIGMSQPALSAIENGDTDIDEMKVGTFMKLLAELKTNAAYLYAGRGSIGPDFSADTEEAEAASLYRQIEVSLRGVWITTGRVFAASNDRARPSKDRPYLRVMPLPARTVNEPSDE